MDMNGICGMGLSPTLTAGEDKDHSQESLSLEEDTVNNFGALETARMRKGWLSSKPLNSRRLPKPQFWVFLTIEDVLINAPSQAASRSQTSSIGGEMKIIVQG